MFETVLPIRFDQAPRARRADRAGEGLTLLNALALFQEGDVQGCLRCMRSLRESGDLVELVDLLCPDFSAQRNQRAQRIRRRVLNPDCAGQPPQREPGPGAVTGTELTPRQRLVLGLVRDGLSNKQIAARLLISTNTVKWHLKTMSRLLGAANRCSVLRIAGSRGLL